MVERQPGDAALDVEGLAGDVGVQAVGQALGKGLGKDVAFIVDGNNVVWIK